MAGDLVGRVVDEVMAELITRSRNFYPAKTIQTFCMEHCVDCYDPDLASVFDGADGIALIVTHLAKRTDIVAQTPGGGWLILRRSSPASHEIL